MPGIYSDLKLQPIQDIKMIYKYDIHITKKYHWIFFGRKGVNLFLVGATSGKHIF